jgi:hypothetical protein
VWIDGKPPENQHPRVCFDPNDPLFAQMGEDSREATAEHGNDGVKQVVDFVTSEILEHLSREG